MLLSLLADLILVVHTAFVAFVVLGLPVVLIGGALKWQWVRNRWFRGAHFAAIGIVVLQQWAGLWCPLTTWENRLRAAAGQAGYPEGFIAYWLHGLLFYDLPRPVFTAAYTAFGALVLLSLWWVPVRWRGGGKDRDVERDS